MCCLATFSNKQITFFYKLLILSQIHFPIMSANPISHRPIASQTIKGNTMKKILLTAAMITLSAGAFAGDDRIEREMHQDASFEQNRTKAVQMLEARGYQVRKIDADDHQGKPVFDVEAYKGNKEFDIKLSYPDLRILKEKEDRF